MKNPRNIYKLALEGHRISRGSRELDEITFESFCEDVKCFAEHRIIGSTAIQVDNPWIPYALLSGKMSIEDVNAERKQMELEGFVCSNPKDFRLSLKYEVFISLSPADFNTLEVPVPHILKVTNLRNGVVVPNQEELKRNPFRGKYWDWVRGK